MPDQDTEPPIEARLNERLPPNGPVVMYQRWTELLFLHWAVAPEVVQAGLPEGLSVDTYEGKAWIGVVPFFMNGVRPRFLPSVPWFSNFPELNLRTYVVDARGRPGVWFYSLDTPQPLANWIARRFFHLNYRTARFAVEPSAETIRYESRLRLDGAWDEAQTYNWTRQGASFTADPGTLEFFLVERYRLFSYDWERKQLFSGQVHHRPYPLHQVELTRYSKHLFSLNKLATPASAPASVLASKGVDVTVHPLARVE
ncbi:MAG: DUF2071 domain-containing protein [Opitutales bacterium]